MGPTTLSRPEPVTPARQPAPRATRWADGFQAPQVNPGCPVAPEPLGALVAGSHTDLAASLFSALPPLIHPIVTMHRLV